MTSADELWPRLEVEGEDEVRKKVAIGAYNAQKLSLVQEWLRQKDIERDARNGASRDAREDKALALSAEANAIARKGNTIAWIALVLSLAALVISFIN